MKISVCAVAALLFFAATVRAQTDTLTLTLDQAIAMGQKYSVTSSENMYSLHSAYVQYRNYRAGLLPNISLSATMPRYNKSLSSYQDADGTYRYIETNNMSEGVGLTLSQELPWTGGRLSLSSSIDRTDQLSGNKKGSFMALPLSVTYSQPLFAFNSARWMRKIEPLRYEASRAQYAEAMEQVNVNTVNYYFDFLNSGVNRDIAYRQRDNAHGLYNIALAKKTLGIISDIDVMQLQVGVLNADANVKRAEQDYIASMNALKNYLGVDDRIAIVPVTPDEKQFDGIDVEQVRSKSLENNPVFQGLELRLKDAEMGIARARAELFPQINFYLSAGLTGSNSHLRDAYSNLSNRMVVEAGFSVPILDWGKRRNNRALAENRYDLEKQRVEREEQNFSERIRELIQVIADQPEQTRIYAEAASIAEKRYKIAFEKFALGTISILDINTAEQEAENARRNYINQLHMSWLYFYNIRYITLYDFEKGRDIEYDIEF